MYVAKVYAYTIAGWRNGRIYLAKACLYAGTRRHVQEASIFVGIGSRLTTGEPGTWRQDLPVCAGDAEANVWNTVKVHSSEPSKLYWHAHRVMLSFTLVVQTPGTWEKTQRQRRGRCCCCCCCCWAKQMEVGRDTKPEVLRSWQLWLQSASKPNQAEVLPDRSCVAAQRQRHMNIMTSDSSKEQLLNECIKIEQFILIFPFSYHVTIPLSRKDYEIITLCTRGNPETFPIPHQNTSVVAWHINSNQSSDRKEKSTPRGLWEKPNPFSTVEGERETR